MNFQNTFSGTFTKVKGLLPLCALLALADSGQLNAQTTSYSANSTPVNGANNTAFGQGALLSNTSLGIYNTATGINTLRSNTTGTHNTATGFHALISNTSGSVNTATGANALVSNTTGNNNTATGSATGIGEGIYMAGASIDQNVPNPFSRETVINFNLPQQVKSASLVVYDLAGKKLKSIPVSGRGASSVTITADELAAGTYVYSIIADGKLLGSKKMVVAGK